MDGVVIDKSKTSREVFYCPRELLEAVNLWRRAQTSPPPKSAAFAELIREGLERWREEQRKPERKS